MADQQLFVAAERCVGAGLGAAHQQPGMVFGDAPRSERVGDQRHASQRLGQMGRGCGGAGPDADLCGQPGLRGRGELEQMEPPIFELAQRGEGGRPHPGGQLLESSEATGEGSAVKGFEILAEPFLELDAQGIRTHEPHPTRTHVRSQARGPHFSHQPSFPLPRGRFRVRRRRRPPGRGRTRVRPRQRTGRPARDGATSRWHRRSDHRRRATGP